MNDAPVFIPDTANQTTLEDTAVNGSVSASDADGNPLSYAVGMNPANGVVVVNANGTYTYTPNADYAGTDSFTVTVTDGQGGTDTITVNVGITPVNDAPTGTSNTFTIAEDASRTFSASDFGFGDALDNPANALQSVVIDTLPPAGEGSLLLNGVAVTAGQEIPVGQLGQLVFVAAPNFNGTGVGSFNFQVRDNGGTANGGVNLDASPNTISFVIGGANDAPVFTPDTASQTTLEDNAVSGVVSAIDADGDTLTYAVGMNPANGAVVVNANGTYTYTPDINYAGTDSFTVTVSDGQGGQDTITVNVNITPVNDAPAGANSTYTIVEDGTRTFAAVDFGFGDALDNPANALQSVIITSLPPGAQGILRLNGVAVTAGQEIPAGQLGQLVFTAAPNFNGTGVGSFTFQVKDNGGVANGGVDTDASPNTISFNITAVNDVPVANADARTTAEDTPVSGTVTASDADGNPLVFSKATDPTNGAVVVNPNGTYTYTPNANYFGPDSFTVSVSDGQGGVTTAVVSITVTEVVAGNNQPVVNQAASTTQEDTAVNGAVIATDPDGDTLTFTKATDPANGAVVVNTNGTYTYTPNANYFGPDSFTVTVADGQGGVVTTTVNVTVTPVNDVPVATPAASTTAEDTPVTGTVTASDADGNPLTFVKATDPANGTVVVNANGTYTYTPNANYFGPDSFTVNVSDGQGGTTTTTVSVTVTPVNDIPVVAPPAPVTTPAGTPVGGTVTATDADGNTLTFSQGGTPSNGTVVVNPNGTYTYTPNPGFNGPDSFVVSVSDGAGGTATATVNVTVTPVTPGNTPPVANPGAATTAEDTPVSGTVTASDVDGDTLAFTKATDPANGTVVVNANGTYTYTPNANYFGADSFTVTVSDGRGGSSTAVVNLTVTPVNDAPVIAQPAALTTPNATPVSGTVTATDVDGNALTFSQGGAPSNGTVVVNPNGSYTYTPNSTFSGTDSFVVTVSDGAGGTTSATVSVTVLPANPPVITIGTAGGAVSTPEDMAVASQVIATDSNGNPLTFSMGSNPANGTVVVNPNGTYTYTPNANFNGSDSFTITVSNGINTPVTTTVRVTVTPVNDAPVANNDTVNVPAGTPSTIAVLGNDTDVEGNPLTVTAASSSNGSVTIGTNGTLLFTPQPGFVGPALINYTISDGQGGTASAQVQVNVVSVTETFLPDARPISTPSFDTPLQQQVITPALFVAQAVNASQVEISLLSNFGTLQTDVATSAELTQALGQDFSFGTGSINDAPNVITARNNALGRGQLSRDNALYVQQAVRHQPLSDDPTLFVQRSVRASQAEAQLRAIEVDAVNSAIPGVASLLDPFALGSPVSALQNGGNEGANEKPAVSSQSAAEGVLAGLQDDCTRMPQAAEQDKPAAQIQPRRAAAGFGKQLERMGSQFRPHAAKQQLPSSGGGG
ncbi:MAG: Ig-like domain-containing protein [Pseudomonadota bacterium]